jgi:sucrose-phosphate synthase
MSSNNKTEKGLYIQLYSIHGLIRGHDLELGRDADTGGQTKYVVELGNALSIHERVSKVELITRWINDKNVSADYARIEEKINEKFSIIRMKCGGSKYIRKELLWNHLSEFVDNCIKYIKSGNRVPDIIHSHYADAGYVGIELATFFGLPLIHTGHSLGRSKLSKLLNDGLLLEDIERVYKINHRIEVEENIINMADLIITSTKQEIEKQYGEYKNSTKSKIVVIPPGVDLDKFHPPDDPFKMDEDTMELINKIRHKLLKFFVRIDKPLILTICRPDKRKNISGLITAYGEDDELQDLANLAIFAGIREDIQTMPDNEKEVLTDILLLMDKYNLYGKMAIPKRHDNNFELPELYRIASANKGVFINSALTEPFGLTIIEAAASGVPVVATNDGGPKDIIDNLKNGILVDVTVPSKIAKAIKIILKNEVKWTEFAGNGLKYVKKFYSWEAHVISYLNNVDKLIAKYSTSDVPTFVPFGRKVMNIDKLIVTDIDKTLLGDDEALKKFNSIIERLQDRVGFAVATGRTIESAMDILKKNNVLLPIIFITSVGTEIYYNYQGELFYSKGWDAHIAHLWNRKLIVELLSKLDFLTLQEEETQRKYKISYYIDNNLEHIGTINNILSKSRIKVKIIFSQGSLVDILPSRASKGKAIRYLSYIWNLPYENILVAGDSGNDIEMLKGVMPGVVVGNYAPELEELKGSKRVFFSDKFYADGIIDGIEYYHFLR